MFRRSSLCYLLWSTWAHRTVAMSNFLLSSNKQPSRQLWTAPASWRMHWSRKMLISALRSFCPLRRKSSGLEQTNGQGRSVSCFALQANRVRGWTQLFRRRESWIFYLFAVSRTWLATTQTLNLAQQQEPSRVFALICRFRNSGFAINEDNCFFVGIILLITQHALFYFLRMHNLLQERSALSPWDYEAALWRDAICEPGCSSMAGLGPQPVTWCWSLVQLSLVEIQMRR